MYNNTVTIFNGYAQPITGNVLWYPHVLKGVDLNTDRGAILKKYGQDSADNAQLHVRFVEKDGVKLIQNASGKLLPWLPPKEWKAQTNDKLSESITFGPDDFFIRGEIVGESFSDEDYRGGFYQYMNMLYDFVFKVTSVGGPYSVIPHFEILGK